MALPKLESLITVPAGGWSLLLTDNDGTVTVTVPAGDYYWRSAAPGGSVSFLQQLKTTLDNGAGVTYTVALDDATDTSTGKLTITPSAGNVTIAWGSSTILRGICGFTGDAGPNAAVTGVNQVTRAWLPNAGRVPETPDPAFGEGDAGAQKFGREEADYIFTVAPSGAGAATVYNRRRLDRLAWMNIYGQKFWIADEQTTNESFQKFWGDVMDAGGVPIRYYADRSSATRYWTHRLDKDAAELRPVPQHAGWVGPRSLWAFSFGVREYA